MDSTNHHTRRSPAGVTHNQRQDESEKRRARRLAADLGINPAGVEVVLRLRRQVIELQARVLQLEGSLGAEQARTAARIALYRREYHEAIVRAEE